MLVSNFTICHEVRTQEVTYNENETYLLKMKKKKTNWTITLRKADQSYFQPTNIFAKTTKNFNIRISHVLKDFFEWRNEGKHLNQPFIKASKIDAT